MRIYHVLVPALFIALSALPGPVAETEGEIPAPDVPLQIPADAKARSNPLQASDENLIRGTKLFSSQCAMCHGSSGAGDGKLAGRLKIEMPDFTDSENQRGRTDGEMFYIISNGHGRMPAETRLPEESRWSMVLAIRAMRR